MTDVPTSGSSNILVGSGPVLLEWDSGIAVLTLNRPESSNALNYDLLVAMHQAVMRCHAHPDVRVVVLRGAGRNFCAGGDVKDFASKGAGLPDYLRETTAYLQMIVGAMTQLNAPVVASVQGYATGGGGFGFVCAADLVVAARSAKFMAGATRVGMAPDAGLSVTLPNLVGFRRAADILYRNPILTADDAARIGIVNDVVEDADLADRTMALARELASAAPLSLAQTKRLLWKGVGSSLESCLPDESRTVAMLSGTDDSREGLAAVIEKRTPVFRGS